jgi:hypothetical protein
MTDTGMILQTATILFEPGTVTEIRILNTPRDGTVSGYFDNGAAFTKAASGWSGKAPAVYTTLNPCTPALLARSANHLTPRAKTTTADHDIERRRWFPLDFDPVRPAGISSTDAEHDAALERTAACAQWLQARGWPRPVHADSGNGGHGLYSIDLPNDDASRTLLQTCLEVLALYFNDSVVSLDVGVFNAARIWKVYGTLARKGDNLPDRPHRLSRLLGVPDPLVSVTREQLEVLAALVPAPPTATPRRGSQPHQPFDGRQWIASHAVPVVDELPWKPGCTKWILNPCPWNSDHTNKSAFIVQFASGAMDAGCHHNGCQGNNWHALRDVYEPGWQTPRFSSNGTTKPAGVAAEPTEDDEAVPLTMAMVTAPTLLGLKLPPRETYFPWLVARTLTMVYGPAGVGKTMFLMSLGLSLATAKGFLTWGAPTQAVPVLYIDGEMSLKELQERLEQLAGPTPPPGLKFLPSELVYERVGRDLTLTTAAERAELDAIVETNGIKVLVLDNVSTLFPGLDESSKRDWEPIAAWLIRLRHRGVTVMIGHHAGKNGLQRGTSGREGAINTTIALTIPPDHKPEDGCHFFLHFEKSRGVKGAAVTALDARLEEVDTRLVFTAKPLEATRTDQVKAMLVEGLPVKVIADELQVHLSYVYRMKKRLGI